MNISKDLIDLLGKSRTRNNKTTNLGLSETLIGHSLAVTACYCALVKGTKYDNKYFIFAVFLHDLGKISWYFQDGLMLSNIGIDIKSINTRVYHNKSGAIYIRNGLIRKMLNIQNENVIKYIEQATMHHGYFINNKHDAKLNSLLKSKFDIDMPLIVEFIQIAMEMFDVDINEFPEIKSHDMHNFLGYLTLSDWLMSSNYNKIKFSFPFGEDKASSLIKPKYKKDSLNSIESLNTTLKMYINYCNDELLTNFSLKARDVLKEDIMGDYDMRSIQEYCYNNEVDGLRIIEAPMGEGKTEAMLLSLRKTKKRICILMPTRATSNGLMAKKDNKKSPISNFSEKKYGKESAVYYAGKEIPIDTKNDIFDDDDNTPNFNFCKPASFLYPLTIMTIDQAVRSVTSNRDASMRSALLSESVIVIDEIHAYDNKLLKSIKSLLSFLGKCKSPTILMSATLPSKKRNELIDSYYNKKTLENKKHENSYPVIYDGNFKVTAMESVRKRKIKFSKIGSNYSCIDKIINTNKGSCIGIVKNTVKSAVKLYNKITSKNRNSNVILIHSKFCYYDRNMIEKDLINRLGKTKEHNDKRDLIVISTQVIEQSLDIDFDIMISDPATIDIIYQRAGRLHRHHERGIANFYIIDNDNYYVYKSGINMSNSDLVKISMERIVGNKSLPEDIKKDIVYVFNEYNEPAITDKSNYINWDNDIIKESTRSDIKVRDNNSISIVLLKDGDYLYGSEVDSTVSISYSDIKNLDIINGDKVEIGESGINYSSLTGVYVI